MKIIKIHAREILDSRGNPTIETEMLFENNQMVRASVPSGASTGENEALELRDNDDRYQGKGVLEAVNNVNTIINDVLKNEELNQTLIDNKLIKLDGTPNKSKLGANAILSVSLCVMKGIALQNNKDLFNVFLGPKKIPIPMFNIINGGMHASSTLEFQEFMIVPKQDKFKEKIRCACEIFQTLKGILKGENLSVSVGDEGGFAPTFKSIEEALDLIMEAINKSNYKAGEEVSIALDSAANSFYKDGKYTVNKKEISKGELIDYYVSLVDKYPIISIEDAFAEDDKESMIKLTELLGNKIMLVGDDYFVTNIKYLQDGIDNHYNNAILLKANQIGTITEMLETIKLAKINNFKTVISHRSGETEDTFISDLAVGLNIDYIKSGSVCRGERICKYNQLLRIEEKLDNMQ